MNFYNNDIDDVFKYLDSNINGLSLKEVSERQTLGLNEITDRNNISPFKRFISQFNNVMIILLLIVGVLSFVYSYFTHSDYTDGFVILFSVIVNATMGYIQEKKAEDSLETLKSYVISSVKVIRNGVQTVIDSKYLVKGDIIVLESGDKIPADARIIECIGAKTDESILTGESVSVLKTSDVLENNLSLHERTNMIYSGTILESGKIKAIVTNIGNNTSLGSIAKNLDREKEVKTPLELKVEKVSKFITFVAMVLIIFVICYGVLTKQSLLTIIMLCISMILASVPENLPVAITATLSVGASEMAKKKAIVRKLSAIETLGATDIICSDKTGTLTTNQMSVVRFTIGKKLKLNVREGISDPFFVNIIALCNNASYDGKEYYGDSVEVAFLRYLESLNISKKSLEEKSKRITEFPFDSERKIMSTLNEIDGKKYLLVKGSPATIVRRCKYYRDGEKIRPLNIWTRNIIKKHEKSMAFDALKVIGFAYKPISSTEVTEDNLIFVGLMGLIDPPRSDVKEAINRCKDAGVSPIMITGDSLETALAIGKEVGIVSSNKEGMLGEEIRNLSSEELDKVLKKVKVFARVTPEDKVLIVTHLQKQGKVIAMSGDGVNDAPAIKLASVGIGMGKTGSDVTKGASDIILMDDSFSSIVTAIEEGRRIYDNVINNILYNLSSNFAEIIIILVGMFTFKNIISPIHVLYIDLVADAVPSICLAFEIGSKDLMKRKPLGLNQSIFTPQFLAFLSLATLIEVLISLFVFFLYDGVHGMGQTMALLSIVINEFIFAYNCRSIKEEVVKRGVFSNKYLNIGIFSLIILQLLVFLSPIGSFFDLVRISLLDFVVVILINIVGFVMIELTKPLIRRIIK